MGEKMRWAHPKSGKKFALTELGFEIARIRMKFEESYPLRGQYEHAVPQTWVDSKLVREVDE